VEISDILPVTVLTNATLFHPKRLQEMAAFKGRKIRLQISLDRPTPSANDAMRGPENFHKVVQAVPALIERGVHVRIASTLDQQSDAEARQLQRLVQKLGVSREDHVIRPIVHRGRAEEENLGIAASYTQLPPELTISTQGAFWSPFGPTYKNGRLQTDLLLTRITDPLSTPSGLITDLLANDSQGRSDVNSGFV
jgi:hypothetical protein